MLVTKMNEAAKNENLDVETKSYPTSEFLNEAETADVVLLGPQIGYEKDARVKQLAGRNIPIEIIPMADYGLMDGKKVLDFALSLKK
jgi:PTS system cellobiose-specific IIB component